MYVIHVSVVVSRVFNTEKRMPIEDDSRIENKMPKTQSNFSNFVEERLREIYNWCPNEEKAETILRLHKQVYHDVTKYLKENKVKHVTVKRITSSTNGKNRKKCNLYVAIQNLLLR